MKDKKVRYAERHYEVAVNTVKEGLVVQAGTVTLPNMDSSRIYYKAPDVFRKENNIPKEQPLFVGETRKIVTTYAMSIDEFKAHAVVEDTEDMTPADTEEEE